MIEVNMIKFTWRGKLLKQNPDIIETIYDGSDIDTRIKFKNNYVIPKGSTLLHVVVFLLELQK